MEQSKNSPSPPAKQWPIVYMASTGSAPMVYNLIQEWASTQLECEVVILKDPMDLFQIESPAQRALIVYSLNNKNDLVEITKAIQEITARQWHWSIQVIVLSTLSHPRVFKFLRKLNSTVIDSKETSLRAIKVKIQKQVQLLELSLHADVPAFLTQLNEASKKMAPFKILWEPSLVLESDFWIIPQERFIYRAHEKWIFVMIGPSQWAGEWVKSDLPKVAPSKESSNIKWWRWTPVSGKDESPGAWFFRGLKPKFSAGRWTFMGVIPKLVWVCTDESPSLVKFETISHEEVQLAPNSAFSIRFLPEPPREETDVDQSNMIVSKDSSSFMRIVETEIIYGFLNSAKRSKASVSLWIQKNPERWHGRLNSFEPSNMLMKVDCKNEKNEALNLLTKVSGDNMAMGNFFIPEGSIFFTANQIDFDQNNNQWLIRPQKVFYHVQRRKDSRTVIVGNSEISALTKGVHVNIHDLSVGGIGLKGLDITELPLLVGETIELNISLYMRIIFVKAEVRWLRAIQKDAGKVEYNAGLKFIDMAAQDIELLGIFTFEQDMENMDES